MSTILTFILFNFILVFFWIIGCFFEITDLLMLPQSLPSLLFSLQACSSKIDLEFSSMDDLVVELVVFREWMTGDFRRRNPFSLGEMKAWYSLL